MSANSIGFGARETTGDNRGLKAVEQTFSPEFRNRLDGIVQFNHLSTTIMEKIVDKEMDELKHMLKSRQISVSYPPGVRSYLAKQGYDPKFGARPLARLIQTRIKDRLTDEILFGKLAKGGRIVISLKNDDLTFSFKH
jgi:ATP-dependent Clp protease ATP-binding subunit ClpA